MSLHAARPWPGAVEWGSDWLEETATELAHLGFVLRDGGMAGSMPGPRLMVALRDQPTLEHFDPEEATYWVAHAGRGRLAGVGRDTVLPLSRPFSWGRIQVADRIPVTNQFLSFGGTLLADDLDEHVSFVAFVSRAPIVRWAGHSQGIDPMVDEIGAFFARLMVPIDFQAEAEARILAEDPEALYAAFLHDAGARLRPGRVLRESYPELAVQVSHESRRLEHDAPAAWREGEALLAWLELG